MKRIIITVLILLVSSISYSQTGWFQQQSGTTNSLSNVYFINDLTGWIVGGDGTVLKTTNAGINWITQASNTTKHLFSVFFLDENTG